MTTLGHTRTRITPWDDRDFVRAFEDARAAVTLEGMSDGPATAAKVRRRLHEAGYPDARVDVVRTATEALDHVSHWIVTRDP